MVKIKNQLISSIEEEITPEVSQSVQRLFTEAAAISVRELSNFESEAEKLLCVLWQSGVHSPTPHC